MGEAIEQGRGHLGVTEHAGPFAKAEISGDDDAGVLVEPAEQMEEQSGTDASRSTEPRDGAESVRRSIKLIDIIAAGPAGGMGLAEIAERSGLKAPTAHRMLKVLVELQAIEKRERSRRYVVGSQVRIWANARPQHLRLQDLARPSLMRAAASLSLSSSISHRDYFDATCLGVMSERFGSQGLVGVRRPLGGPASGLAMLTVVSESDAETVIRHNLDRFHQFYPNIGAVYHALKQTRERGFALRRRGLVTGLTTVALPIDLRNAGELAAIAVSQTPDQADNRWIDTAVAFLSEEANAIRKGYSLAI